MPLAFFDKDPNANLTNGVLFCAAGLVTQNMMVNDEPNLSGKDYCVEFNDPWGNYQCEWRAKSDVVVYELCEADADMLRLSFVVSPNERPPE